MTRSTSARKPRGRQWSASRLWAALMCSDKKALAGRIGCSSTNVYSRVQRFRATSPGGSGLRHFSDRDIHRQMALMLDEARFEVLAAVAFVSPDPPAVFEQLLSASRRGVDVQLLFRSDNVTGALVRAMQSAGVTFRTLGDLHAKFLITDTTALNGSANLTRASADRASEVATFFSDAASVYALRTIFMGYWQRARVF